MLKGGVVMKLWSICIPTYNGEKYIARLLDSIISQINDSNRTEVEICISNNCSADNTEDIVLNIISQNKSVPIVYNKRNETCDSAENFVEAVKMSTGYYCSVIGDDDWLLENSMSYVLGKLNAAKDMGINTIISRYDTYDTRVNDNVTVQVLKDISADRVFNMNDDAQFQDYFKHITGDLGNAGMFSFLSSVIFRPKSWLMESEIASSRKFSCYLQSYRHINALRNGDNNKLLFLTKSYLYRNTDRDNILDRPNGARLLYKMLKDTADLIEYYFEGELKEYLQHQLLPANLYCLILNPEITEQEKQIMLSWNSPGIDIMKKIYLPADRMDLLKDKKIYLFGASAFADRTLDILNKRNISILGYVDNNKKKQGSLKNDIMIFSPELLKETDDKDTAVIIASSYLLEIYEQLNNMQLKNISIYAVR